MKSRFMISCAVVAMATGAADAAFAQDAAPQAAEASAPLPGEIIVTAQRRDQSIQDVPFTLQAFSGETLSKLNVTTFNDLLKYTPNVTFGGSGPGNGTIFFRGLSSGAAGSQSAGSIGGFPNVALYLDDQSMSFPAHNADVYVADIERVEVLEGPQGTLFGGGAQAGVVRYITNKPKLGTFEGKLEGSFGGTSGGAPNAAFNATINVPIIADKLAIRAVIYGDHHGGYIDNVFSTFTRQISDPASGGDPVPPQINGGKFDNTAQVKNDFNPVDYAGGRVSLSWQATPDWNLLVSQSYQNLKSEGSFAAQSYSYDYDTLTGGLKSTLFNPQYNKDEYWNTAWTADGKIGDFKVLYTGAYLTRHISQQGDYTNYARQGGGAFYSCSGAALGWGTGPVFCYSPSSYWTEQSRTTHQSHEIRIATPDNKRIRAIVGGYYESYKIQDDSNWDYRTIPGCRASDVGADGMITADCVGTVHPYPGAPANIPGEKGPSTAFGESVQRGYKQYAAFASVDFDILPNLTLTGGTRYYSYDEYESGSEYYSTAGNCYQKLVCSDANYGAGFPIGGATGYTVNFHGFKSKGSITWKPKQGTLVYGLFSQGFRPGLFNRTGKTVAADPLNPAIKQLEVFPAIAPDTLTNWEIGLKTDLFDRKLQLNLSGYYMIWQDVQFGYFNPSAGFGNTSFGINGASYHIKGIEAQIVARPVEGLTIQAAATYNDSQQASEKCFVSNVQGSSTFGQCITQVYNPKDPTKPIQVSSPFGKIGDVLPFSPKVQASLRGRYEWTGKGDMNWFVSSGVSYTGAQFNAPSTYPSGEVADGNSSFQGPNGIVIPGTTSVRYRMPGYAIFDASFGFTKDNVTVTVFGDNIGNSRASTFTTAGQYIKTTIPVRPRTYGVKISSKF